MVKRAISREGSPMNAKAGDHLEKPGAAVELSPRSGIDTADLVELGPKTARKKKPNGGVATPVRSAPTIGRQGKNRHLASGPPAVISEPDRYNRGPELAQARAQIA